MRIESCGQSFGCKNSITDRAMQVMAKRMKSGEFVKRTERFFAGVENYPYRIEIDTIGKSKRLKATCFINDGSCVFYKENWLEALFSPKKLLKKVFRVNGKLSYICEKGKLNDG